MGGAWSCFYTDACLSPSCGEDGGPAMKPGLIHVTVNYMGSVTETSSPKVRFRSIAHSMRGAVARCFWWSRFLRGGTAQESCET